MAIRHEMKEALERSNLHTLQIKATAFQWHKKNKEIKIGDRFFDVKHLQLLSNGNYLVTGLYDDEETSLENKANALLNQSSKNKQWLAALFLQWYTDLVITETFVSVPIVQIFSSQYLQQISNGHINIVLPPPDWA
jgi:hypothetical protein